MTEDFGDRDFGDRRRDDRSFGGGRDGRGYVLALRIHSYMNELS